MSAALALYRAVAGAAHAIGLTRLALRGKGDERRERLGNIPEGGSPAPVWIHAASLGETAAAAALIRALRAGNDGRRAPRVALSATTRAGRERAMTLNPDVGPFFLPLDAPRVVRLALDRLEPRALVLLETELWPSLLSELAAREIPWGVASARLSERGARRMRLAGGLYARLLREATAIGARSEEAARHYIERGARPDAVRVTGDLKTSLEVPEFETPPPGAFRWIAACTRPGEEVILLEATDTLAASLGAGETWIAPRHADRFEEVAALLRRAGRPWRRWRDAPRPEHAATWTNVLVDEMGVLGEAYRRTSCAFVGGSLVPLGGHNPLEAAAAGRAVFTGPHVENCAEAVARLVAGGAARQVASGAELARELTELARDSAECVRRGRAARGIAARSSSAARDTVEFFALRGLLPR